MALLVLEFNELSPALIDRFIGEGVLPNFARMKARALVATTDAEEAPPFLEPWIQWVTVHTGLSYGEHGCYTLDDGAKLEAPRLWDLASAAGKRSLVCGSMNGAVRPGFLGHFLPDPWSKAAVAEPQGFFDPWLELVGAYVQEHSGRPALGARAFARFARFMAGNGLSAGTALAALRQLTGERRGRGKALRALVLDRLQWDLFKALWRRKQPDFATFFINSTAHFQHFHWREMEPERFAVPPSADEVAAYGTAIREGYRAMDRNLGEALALAGSEHHLVMCTALSQQPMLDYEESGGKQHFRVTDPTRLLDFAGVAPGWTYSPVMSQQFMLHFPDEAQAVAASSLLEGLRLDSGERVMMAWQEGERLNCACLLTNFPERGAQVVAGNRSAAFAELFYPLEALRSGMHHPDGALWLAGPGIAPGEIVDRVPLRQVAPTLAGLLGVSGGFALPSLLVR